MATSDVAWPEKLPVIGAILAMSTPTATGMRPSSPRRRLVGSNVIQPAPGRKTCAQAWVDPDIAVFGSVYGAWSYPETSRQAIPRLRTASAKSTA